MALRRHPHHISSHSLYCTDSAFTTGINSFFTIRITFDQIFCFDTAWRRICIATIRILSTITFTHNLVDLCSSDTSRSLDPGHSAFFFLVSNLFIFHGGKSTRIRIWWLNFLFWNGNTRLWQSRLQKSVGSSLSPSSHHRHRFLPCHPYIPGFTRNICFLYLLCFAAFRAASSCSVFYAPLGHIGWLIPPPKIIKTLLRVGLVPRVLARISYSEGCGCGSFFDSFLILSVTTWSRRGGSISFSLALFTLGWPGLQDPGRGLKGRSPRSGSRVRV